jgi:hypothetical protein
MPRLESGEPAMSDPFDDLVKAASFTGTVSYPTIVSGSRDPLTLTLDALCAMAAKFKPLPRIIVGMPIVQADEAWKRESDGMLFIGNVAWRELLKSTVQHQPTNPVSTLFGLQIEYFGDHSDHFGILRELCELIMKGKALRVALDEEFGNTNPRIG